MAADPAPPSVRPRPRWRVRLSLRALMVLILVIGFPLGWKARRASIQRRAVAAVRAIGGKVSYEDELNFTGFPRLPHCPGRPAWLRRLIWDEFFQEVAWLSINLQRITTTRRVDDESIAVAADFDPLQGLTLWETPGSNGTPPSQEITAAGLTRLTGLSRLRYLEIRFASPDPAILALLPRWPELENVSIRAQTMTLTGSSLTHLVRLPHLQGLTISGISSYQETDRAPLTKLKQPEWVGIVKSSPRDRGLGRFGSRSALKGLHLGSIPVSAATLAELVQPPGLSSLYFDGSRLPPGGLQVLAGLSQLTSLDVGLDGLAAEPNSNHLIHRIAKHFGDPDLDALRLVPLISLTVMGLDATDAGVGRLLQSHSFRSLTLSGRGITDASIPLLVQQAQLTSLVLADTSITDTGLAQLAALTSLRMLSLVDNPLVTDDGATRLRTFPALTYLTIRQPAVQPSTLETIRAARSKFGPFNLFQPPD